MAPEAAHSAVEADSALVSSAVADPLRRLVLRVLRDVGTELSIADLAREVARRKTGDRASEVSWEQVRQYHVMLYHAHVPKLAAAGLVDFDLDARAVAPAPLPDDVEARVDEAVRPS